MTSTLKRKRRLCRLPSRLIVEEGDDIAYILKKRGANPLQIKYVEENPTGRTIYFNSRVACTYGKNAAIFFGFVSYWVDYNEKHNINFKKERYWTYGSLTSLQERYLPFLSISELRRAIDKLVVDRVITKSNKLNRHNYDRTSWYTINQERVNSIFGCTYKELLKM